MKQINWGFIGCGEVTEKKSGPAFNEVEYWFAAIIDSKYRTYFWCTTSFGRVKTSGGS